MFRHLKTWWFLALLLLSLPTLLSIALGWLWLWEHDWLLVFMLVTTVVVSVGVPLVRWLRAKSGVPRIARVEPLPHWAPMGREAWKRVEEIARRAEASGPPADWFDTAWKLLREVFDTVSRHYHPRSKQPLLEVPAPYVLRIVELVTGDLRAALTEYVPGSHVVTIHELERLRKVSAYIKPLWNLYRLVSFGFSPGAALVREFRDYVAGKMISGSSEDVARWAIGYYVRKCGYYAIQLYSGHLTLDGVAFPQRITAETTRDTAEAREQERQWRDEPLRILVVGQVKAGKSSAINALFGETRAATDVVPRTRDVTPYILERDGIPGGAIILDTSGYATVDRPADAFAGLRNEILQCDLILLVLTVGSAAREADRRLLDSLRALYQQSPDRAMPPLVVVVTHIDQVRPLAEWSPPYNLEQPEGAKAHNIADAVLAVAEDLAVAPADIVPVCLKPGLEYNVEEGLVPAIFSAFSEAQRVRYLRVLRHHRRRDNWELLWQQAVQSGRILWRTGLEGLKAGERR